MHVMTQTGNLTRLSGRILSPRSNWTQKFKANLCYTQLTLSQGEGGRRKERRGGEGRAGRGQEGRGKGKEEIEERRVQKRDEKARRVGRRREERQGKGREE